jgi:flagellin-like protein
MNTFRKIRKNAKALSPVVASIILIAVTVAVSVAVAAWMGGMTIGFMGTSSVTVTKVEFTATTIALDLKNTGTKAVAIAQVTVNNEIIDTVTPASGTMPYSIKPGESTPAALTITGLEIVNGNTYKIDLFDGSNQVVGSVQQNSPTS